MSCSIPACACNAVIPYEEYRRALETIDHLRADLDKTRASLQAAWYECDRRKIWARRWKRAAKYERKSCYSYKSWYFRNLQKVTEDYRAAQEEIEAARTDALDEVRRVIAKEQAFPYKKRDPSDAWGTGLDYGWGLALDWMLFELERVADERNGVEQ